jgi:hypothetical protein
MAGPVLVRGVMMAIGHIMRTPDTTGMTVHSITSRKSSQKNSAGFFQQSLASWTNRVG